MIKKIAQWLCSPYWRVAVYIARHNEHLTHEANKRLVKEIIVLEARLAKDNP